MRTEKGTRLEQPDRVLALAVGIDEQERIKSLLRQEIEKYGKQPMDLEQVRSTLERKLGKTSLSRLVIKMRHEGR